MASMSLPPPTFTQFSLWVKSHLLTKNRPPPADLSLKGQTALITGANSGLGLATAKVLLQHGLSRLVIACRSVDKGQQAAARLRAKYEASGAEILVWELDMLSYDSIQRLVKRCQMDLHPLKDSASGRGLDIAILSAGVAQAEFELNESTGHEVMMQTNYLSTALLAFLLLPVLKAKRTQKPGRLTIVASSTGLTTAFANRNEDPLLPTFDDRKQWDATGGFERYGVSKTLVLMLLAKLGEQPLVDDEGNAVTVNALEPGLVTGSNCKICPSCSFASVIAFHRVFAFYVYGPSSTYLASKRSLIACWFEYLLTRLV